ncbi:gliding motility-associated C-terminal domain-containing protein [Flavobacterium aquidurense]|uniref:Ig-like domain-containing protein n=1 Tax=Flavobacterium aquidurense TaxID=362413 RepID=UPI0028649A73|nr:gliding motility-associated C-terminal domain-containing protein [Flavobacterium aquidurense]MDR7370493.1 gliding motility-associated-like protein/uncharacterized repeat protein (TIGR01451 family) [Flavobacterium aquidurense]
MSHTVSQGGTVCVGLGVNNPGNAYNSDTVIPTTFATLINDVGVGCFVEETLTLNQTAKAGDQIVLYIGTGNAVLDAGLLANASIQAKFSGTNVGSSVPLNSPLLNLSLLPGNTIGLVRYTLTGDTNQIQIQDGGLLSLLVNLRVYDVRVEFEKPTVTGGLTQTVNSGNPITLTAVPAAGTTLAWYSSPTSTTPLATGNTFTTSNVTANTTYYIGVSRNGSESDERVAVVVNVNCQPLQERVYANGQSSGSIVTGGVANGDNAKDKNLQTYSTIVTGLGVAGIGTTWQDLFWSDPIPIGTPVTVKLGSEYSGVAVAYNLSVAGVKNGVVVGNYQAISGSLLNLLSGDNSFEFTFVPSDNSGPIDYDGIRILSVPIVSIAQSTRVYEAYYKRQVVGVPACTPGDIQDIFHGVTEIGVGALTATVGVSNAWNVADHDDTTSARMYVGAGVLATADLMVQFKTPFIASDKLKIVVSGPSPILNVNLLNGLSIQRYLGNVAVGPSIPIENTNSLLSINLLSGGFASIEVASSQADPYDRVRISFGGALTVLNFLDVHTVERVANTKVIGGDLTNKVTVCSGSDVNLEVPSSACSTYVWYDAPTAGAVVANGSTFTLPNTLTAGIHKYYVESIRNGCPILERGEVTLEVTDPGTPILVTAGTQNFCLVTAPTFASVQFNQTNIVWYDAVSGGNLIPSTNVLTSGTYYAALKDATTGCESITRLSVTISVNDPGTPTLLTAGTQNFCLVNAPTFASVQFNEANIVWYDLINGGTVIPSTTTLTDGTYFAVIKDPATGCESATRLSVTIDVNDPGTPTLVTAGTQNFCSVDAPTFASVQFNEANIVWYDLINGGTVIPSTTTLTDGTYFAVIKDPATGCESATRLSVTIDVNDPGTPTLVTAGTQNFCLVDAPTFASVQFNEANIVWYDLINGGNVIPSTTTLTDGTYFAVIKDPATGCESATRLSVTIDVNDPGTPTLVTAGTQNFCLVNAPTFASVQFNELNIVWYDLINGGTVIPSTTTLTDGTYFAVIKDPATGCESAIRLSVTIDVNDPGTPTLLTAGTQNFCLVNAPTFVSVQFNEANIVWYDLINGGTVIPSTTTLTDGTYFAVIKDPATGCESATRLSVTIDVNDPGTPTLVTAGTQNFCLVNAPTFASVQFNEANIVWYDLINGGNLIPSTNTLTSGTYYAAIKDPISGCESNARLSVTISVTDPGTPTLVNAGTQTFCLVNALTFASVQFNQTNIVWYDAVSGGNLFPSTAILTSGTYFAALKDATTGCESASRLSVTINVTDPGTPTLVTAGTQNFCLVNAPTFASVQFNQANIVWYDLINGGTVIPSTNALADGTYFAVIKDPATGCESATRLSVTISVTDPGTPTLVNAGIQNFCLVNAPTFASVQFNQTNIVWYDAVTGGNLIPSTNTLTSGTYYAAIKHPIFGCESNTRLSVTINVSDPGTPTLVNAGTQNFCLVNAPTFASVQFNQTNIVWYDAVSGGNLIPSTNTLTSGTYFAALKDATTGCESTTRLSVTISVTDPGTPTLVNAGTQNFCLVNSPTFAGVQFNQTNIVWYDALSGGNLIPSTNALTSGTYFAVLKDAVTGCESASRLSVTINVTDPGTPTLVKTGTQNFCLVNGQTFASVQFNQTNIVWYDAVSGGNLIPSTNTLTSGTYFAALKDAVTGCESASRLSVTINVTDPGTPTLVNAGTQNFCLINAATFASVQFNQTNIVWYDTLSGGNLIPSTNTLTSGTYFAALKDATTGCESTTRLSVTISVTDPGTPTLVNAGTQNFCLINAPTFASVQFNQTNIVWYDAVSGGNLIPSTKTLTSGTYFAALKDVTTGCESASRLSVTISVTDPGTPTLVTAGTQNFCSASAPTFASIQVKESNVSWFNSALGGTAIPSTTPLTSGTYFGEISDPVTGCKSATRLQVTININNPVSTPTTNSLTQNFCSLNVATVANIQVNEANVVWYSTAPGGTALAATTALATGTYYGVVSSPVGCENPVRLAVAVNVNTPAVVTTPRTTQTFCPSALATLANILVNETNVVWYASPTSATPLASNTPLTATTYYAGALNNTTNGCVSATRLGVTINFENDALVQLTTTDDTPCVFQPITYSIANGKSNFVWKVTNGTITAGGGANDGSVTISWSDIGQGKVEVAYINNCNEPTTKTLNVTVATCSDLTITNTVSNPTPNFGEEITFTVTVNNVGQGNFINTIVSDLLPSGYDLVSANTSTGTYDPITHLWTIPTLNSGESVTLTIVAEVVPGGEYVSVASVIVSTPLDSNAANNTASVTVEPICLTVYNEFTPNNDGQNDLFRIDCIESYPNNELKVYNRWGALVYSKQHYENDWNGTANVSGVINKGDMLPTGTYFYVIDIGNGTIKKGWLSIMR